MHPILLNFKFPIYTYGALVALAFALGLKITTDRAARAGLAKDFVLNVFFVTVLSSVFGARFLYVAENWGYFRQHLAETWMVHRGGLSYFGGFVFGTACGAIACKRAGVPFLAGVDVFIPAVALGQAIGRLGCYFNGCCWGIVSDAPWAIVFPAGCPAFADHVARGWISPYGLHCLPVFPAQLASSFGDTLLFCLLVAVDARKKVPGTTFCTYLLCYGIMRFCLEFVRGDGLLLTSVQWTLPQFVSVASAGVGLAGLAVLRITRRP